MPGMAAALNQTAKAPWAVGVQKSPFITLPKGNAQTLAAKPVEDFLDCLFRKPSIYADFRGCHQELRRP